MCLLRCSQSGYITVLDQHVGPWLSLVERLVRDEEVASSNLAGPTSVGGRGGGAYRTGRLPVVIEIGAIRCRRGGAGVGGAGCE